MLSNKSLLLIEDNSVEKTDDRFSVEGWDVDAVEELNRLAVASSWRKEIMFYRKIINRMNRSMCTWSERVII